MAKYPLWFRAVRAMVPVAAKFFPKATGEWAANRFFRPRRFPFREKEKPWLEKVEKFTIEAGGNTIQGYKYGSGPEVMFVHGWEGRAMQFREFIQPIVDAGLTFIAFDAWGHGLSAGSKTHFLEFKNAIEAVAGKCIDLKGAVGHSLGAAALSFAIQEGVKIPRLVTIGAPSIGQEILDEFCKIINAPSSVQKYIRQRAVSQFNREFEDFAMERTFVHTRPIPVLAIHDENDKEAGINHLWKLQEERPEIHTLVTKGLGHRRILKDRLVVNEVVGLMRRSPSV